MVGEDICAAPVERAGWVLLIVHTARIAPSASVTVTVRPVWSASCLPTFIAASLFFRSRMINLASSVGAGPLDIGGLRSCSIRREPLPVSQSPTPRRTCAGDNKKPTRVDFGQAGAAAANKAARVLHLWDDAAT